MEEFIKLIFLVTGIITTYFSVAFIVRYPSDYWECLTFRSRCGITGHLASVGLVGFLITSILTIGSLVALCLQ